MAKYKPRHGFTEDEVQVLELRWGMMQPIRKKYAKQLAQIESSKRQFFRYEHPDLVREGIVFENSQSIP